MRSGSKQLPVPWRLARRGYASSSEQPRPLLQILGLSTDTPREQVRSAYLRAAMGTHPDTSHMPDAAARMAELQQAWERYRASDRYRLSAPPGPGFTAFGVGCSFSDTAEEQAERSALMEKAARGHVNQRRLAQTEEEHSNR